MLRLAAVALLFALPTQARTKLALSAGGAAWSPQKATGAPDCPSNGGDHANGWATQVADEGVQWLELGYANAVPIETIRVFENHNPGAIVKIEALGDGVAITLWEGDAPQKPEPHVFEAQARQKATAKRIRITLDTNKVAGWNEIDAVELVGRDGSRQWASSATASSTYAAAGSGGGPLYGMQGKRVEIRVDGTNLRGQFTGFQGGYLAIVVDGRTTLVNAAKLSWVRPLE